MEDTDKSKKFNFSKADWESFKNNSRKLISSDLICESNSVNQNTEILTNAITEAAERSIPQGGNNKRKRLKPLPYWNQNCKIAVQDRNKARCAMNKNKT